MAQSVEALLSELDDRTLCGNVFDRIVEYRGQDVDPTQITLEERVVLLVWHAYGLIGNGGFRYLLEGELKGDPTFALTAEAFRAVGCKRATAAIYNTLAIFPNSRPQNDIAARLRFYLSRIKQWPTDMDIQFFDAAEELVACLARFIRTHSDAFQILDVPKAKELSQRDPSQDTKERQSRQQAGPTLNDLPHWARVAFAARCAHRVFGLLAQHWSPIPAKRSNAVGVAIKMAQQSAEEGRPIEGLKEAELNSLIAAGAALASHPEFSRGEPAPENALSGTIASFVAKAAEKAAKSARENPDDSLLAALEALSFATQAAASAEANHLVKAIQDDFAKVHRSATREQWTGQTKVSPKFWGDRA